MRRVLIALTMLAAAGMLAAGCGGTTRAPEGPAPAAPRRLRRPVGHQRRARLWRLWRRSDQQRRRHHHRRDRVTTDNFAFLPTALQVKVGQEVTWTTQQDVAHTVTADEGAFAHSMPAGARFALPSPSGQLRLPLHRSPGDARDDRGFVAVRP